METWARPVTFRVWFQYEEQGMEGFEKRFTATSVEEAVGKAWRWAVAQTKRGQGEFSPTFVRPPAAVGRSNVAAGVKSMKSLVSVDSVVYHPVLH